MDHGTNQNVLKLGVHCFFWPVYCITCTLCWSFSSSNIDEMWDCSVCAVSFFFCSLSLIFNPETFLALWQTWVGWQVTPVWCMVHCVTEPLLSSLRVLPLTLIVVHASNTYRSYSSCICLTFYSLPCFQSGTGR